MTDRTVPMTATDEDDVVVFLIGMTFNRIWKVRSWWPTFTAMPRMIKELEAAPELGLLSTRTTIGSRGPTVIQYWRSVEHLERFARAKDHTHTPAWAAFMKSAAATNGDVGIWHETFVTRPGERETIYHATPRFGFGKAASRYAPIGPAEATAKKRRQAGAPSAT